MQRVPGYPQTPAHKDAQRSLAVHRWGGSPGDMHRQRRAVRSVWDKEDTVIRET